MPEPFFYLNSFGNKDAMTNISIDVKTKQARKNEAVTLLRIEIAKGWDGPVSKRKVKDIIRAKTEVRKS